MRNILLGTRQRRSQYDLLRSIVLLCILSMASVTVQTLPQLQSILDGTFLSASDHLSVTMLRTGSKPRRSTLKQQQQQQKSSTNHTGCLKHMPFYANNTRVSINDTLLEQPPAPLCGTLRRGHYWEHIAQMASSKAIASRDLSPLAQQMEQHQSDCSLPVATFHMDNDFGLGSHLYLWSQALCNAWQEGYRVQTYNPKWLWLDQSYCNEENDAKHHQQQQSPLLCYFPIAESRCSSDARQPLLQQKEEPHNVTDPRNERLRCQRLKTNNPSDLSQFRAASMEYLFHQAVSPLVLREAERQVGLLFSDNSSNDVVQAPDNLITVHMRWGDKFWEMDLAPAVEYVNAILELLEQRHNASVIAAVAPVNIYLACEDPRAVEEFLAASPNEWNVYVDRTVKELNAFRPIKGNRASWTTRNTKGRAGLVALASLLVGLEANDFVLTTKSNWSRLMNELRKNVLDRRCGNCTNMIDLRPGEW